MNKEINIVLIGAGKMATHLGKVLSAGGLRIHQVYNRSLGAAKHLAQILACNYTDQAEAIDLNADVYIVCVSDQAIASLSAQFAFLDQKDKLIVHTSGATPGKVFENHFGRYGVFYPLQSLSTEQEVDFQLIPICVDANTPQDVALLQTIARKISQQVYTINDQDRKLLHVAAVFVNNFSNHLYTLMDQWLTEEQLPFELLRPLIQMTAQKLTTQSPATAQTGPAIRGDVDTIERHLAVLSEKKPDLLPLYQWMTHSINPNLLPH